MCCCRRLTVCGQLSNNLCEGKLHILPSMAQGLNPALAVVNSARERTVVESCKARGVT